MKKFSTFLAVLLIFAMALGLTACKGADPADVGTSAEDKVTHLDVLVAYFSATGTTKGVAEKLAGSGTWLQGKRFGGNVSEADLKSWIEGLK